MLVHDFGIHDLALGFLGFAGTGVVIGRFDVGCGGTGGKDDNGNDIVFHVKVGDKVLISKYGGTEVKVDGQEVIIISQNDILGVVG